MRKLLKEFKAFVSRGNILDMAVGVIIGSSFTAIINSLVNGILYPFLSLLGAEGTKGWITVLRPATETSEAIVIDWGSFVSAIVYFLMVALILFTLVKIVGAARRMIDLRAVIQGKLDKDEPLTVPEERLLRRWQKRDPGNAPKKSAPPAPATPTETERLLGEILDVLKK